MEMPSLLQLEFGSLMAFLLIRQLETRSKKFDMSHTPGKESIGAIWKDEVKP